MKDLYKILQDALIFLKISIDRKLNIVTSCALFYDKMMTNNIFQVLVRLFLFFFINKILTRFQRHSKKFLQILSL